MMQYRPGVTTLEQALNNDSDMQSILFIKKGRILISPRYISSPSKDAVTLILVRIQMKRHDTNYTFTEQYPALSEVVARTKSENKIGRVIFCYHVVFHCYQIYSVIITSAIYCYCLLSPKFFHAQISYFLMHYDKTDS